ncbi:hypothetical protein HJC23_005954 [Cyclotella cryptica]|uniref:Uncharacterized protein n=1 Tax=Cyclotella cryptica TaxID=29204 RepID=A0ABD3RD43_9STRA|eukprot:CCRYP_000538-RA/>CCRYP_000538-RA protein AED:0.31 eAED:0.31 QI:961/1/1/1/0/0/2/1176/73
MMHRKPLKPHPASNSFLPGRFSVIITFISTFFFFSNQVPTPFTKRCPQATYPVMDSHHFFSRLLTFGTIQFSQ